MVQKHLMYIPWTGLGLFGGFRGNRWLRNRIKVFKQFVYASLVNQSNQNFIVWCSWRPEEKNNQIVKEFIGWLDSTPLQSFHTFTGVCFYDDKYPKDVARARLLDSLHGAVPDLMNAIGECDYVLMTIQPSDDCYHENAVEAIQTMFKETDLQAVGFSKGYIMDYTTKELAEYNPNTNPPFYTIKFPRETFVNALAHLAYTGLKTDVGEYPKGTPLPSHEYVKDCLKYEQIDKRGFLVGTHGENISTYFNHPFKGAEVDRKILKDFGLDEVPPIYIKTSIKRRILRRLPFKYQRKLRYWIGERLWQSIYEFLRS